MGRPILLGRNAQVASAWASGRTIADLASDLGMSRQGVRMIIYRHVARSVRLPHARIGYGDEDAEITATRRTVSQIQAEINKTTDDMRALIGPECAGTRDRLADTLEALYAEKRAAMRYAGTR